MGHIEGEPLRVFGGDQGLTAVAFLRRIALFDIAGAEGSLQPTGSVLLPEPAQAMVFHGGFLYAATPSWLYAIDVSDPGNPQEVSETPAEFTSLKVDGEILYGVGNLRYALYSLERPGEPQLIASHSREGRVLEIANQRVYLLVGTRLRILSLADPTHPVLVADSELPSYSEVSKYGGTFRWWDFALGGQILYGLSTDSQPCNKVGCFADHTLHTWDLTNPAAPVELGLVRYDPISFPSFFLVSGTLLAVGFWDTVYFRDMTQPDAPVEVAVHEAPDGIIAAWFAGTQFHMVVDGLSFYVIDPDNAQDPRLLGEYQSLGSYYSVEMLPGIALAWSSYSTPQFLAYDLADPGHPERLELNLGEHAPMEVVYRDGLVYTLWEGSSFSEETNTWGDSYGLRILDPTGQPPFRVVTVLDLSVPESGFGYNFGRIRFDGDMLYAVLGLGPSASNGTILGVDVNNPAESVQVLTWDAGESMNAWDIAFADGYAYVITEHYENRNAQFRVFEASLPGAFTEVGTPLELSGARSIQVSGEYAFVAGDRITVLDLGQPDAPVVIGEYDFGFYRSPDFELWGRYLVFANYGGEVLAIDAAVPDQLSLAAIAQIPDEICGMSAYGDIIAVATCDDGLDFYRLANPLPEPQSLTLSPGSSQLLEFPYFSGEMLGMYFPAGAVTETITVTVSPVRTLEQPGLLSTGLGFHLSAPGAGPLSFGEPVAVTLTYQDEAMRTIFDEALLRLLHLDGPDGLDAFQTCPNPQEPHRDPDANRYFGILCQSGTYGLYGPTNWFYLPTMPKDMY